MTQEFIDMAKRGLADLERCCEAVASLPDNDEAITAQVAILRESIKALHKSLDKKQPDE